MNRTLWAALLTALVASLLYLATDGFKHPVPLPLLPYVPHLKKVDPKPAPPKPEPRKPLLPWREHA